MTTKVLLTHHHRDAIENAADRGFWMPLPLEADQLKDVMYLTSLSYGETTLKQLVEVASFEPWRESDGIERWLPFLGQRLELPQPLWVIGACSLVGCPVSGRQCKSLSLMRCSQPSGSVMCCPAPVLVATSPAPHPFSHQSPRLLSMRSGPPEPLLSAWSRPDRNP
jgi:hypothetical protein